jgi:hypothetical protein
MIWNWKNTGLIAFAIVLGSSAVSTEAHANRKHVRDAIVAGAVGVAIGAALSHKHKHRKDVYYPTYEPRYPDGEYDGYWQSSFSPQPGVICYNAQRICYDDNGTISHRYTFRIFGQ